jgi:hypothetical protein
MTPPRRYPYRSPIAPYQCLLLRSRPSLNLALCSYGVDDFSKVFGEDQGNRFAIRRVTTESTTIVLGYSGFEVFPGCADIQAAVDTTKDIKISTIHRAIFALRDAVLRTAPQGEDGEKSIRRQS